MVFRSELLLKLQIDVRRALRSLVWSDVGEGRIGGGGGGGAIGGGGGTTAPTTKPIYMKRFQFNGSSDIFLLQSLFQ